MQQGIFVRNFAIAALIVILFIIYGSLYPFAFHRAPPGALQTLLASWAKRPGRGDALANILLYLPLGYFATAALRRDAGRAGRVIAVMLLGAALSLSIELLQYYDAGRDTEASDVYTNIAGTALGIMAAHGFRQRWKKSPRAQSADPAALLLLAAWAGYNLFPFVPVIDLHKYWNAVKPLLHPALGAYTLFTHVTAWMAVAVLIEAFRGRRAGAWFAAFALVLLGAKILVAGQVLTAAEVLGAVIAFCMTIALQNRPRLKNATALALLGCSVIAQRLEPFQFVPQRAPFGWIPFRSFMFGSVQVDILSFLEKGFLYGGLIWLLQKAGMRLAVATATTAAVLLATSWAEIYLPGRSAEITDAVMALFVGGLIALIRSASSGAA